MKKEVLTAFLSEQLGVDYSTHSQFLYELAIVGRAKLIRQRARQQGILRWMYDDFTIPLKIDDTPRTCSMFMCPVLKSTYQIPKTIYTINELPFVSIYTKRGESLAYKTQEQLYFDNDNRFKRYVLIDDFLYITGTLTLKEIKGKGIFPEMEAAFLDCLDCFRGESKEDFDLPENLIVDLVPLVKSMFTEKLKA